MILKEVVKDMKIQDDTSNGDKEINKVDEDVTYDTLLSSAGELGRYQLLLLFSTFPFYFFGVNVYFSQMFMTEVPPKHWCWIPELENLTESDRRNLAIPKDINSRFGYSQCQAYEANWTEVLATGQTLNDTWKTVPCQNGWEFDKTEFPYPTISSDFGWVCDKSSYQATAQSLFFTGSVIGGVLIGWVGDRFGRIPGAVLSNLFGFAGGLSSTFATNLTQFAICRFIMGMAQDNCVMMAYLIVLEYLGPKYRSVLANTSFAVFYALFSTAFPFIALACGHWKTLSLVSSIPLALAVLTPLFFPESPRWLLSKGRVDEAIGKVLVIGRINRKEVPAKMIEQFKETVSKEEKENNVSSFEVFKRPLLRKILLLACLDYMCCQVVFDGLVRNLEQLGYDYFLSFAASSFTEFPSMVLCAFIMDYFGRKWLTVGMLTIASMFCVLIVFVAAGIPSLMCAVLARFSVNMACSIVVQWAAELLPTQVRGFGTSLVHISANLGIIISPYIAYSKVYVYWLPYAIIAGLAAFGAMISLILPETALKEMPNTFEEAENLAKNQKLWEMPCTKKYRKKCQGHANESFAL